MTIVKEVNFDGLVGPTHHYGGLSYGNLASMSHQKQVAHPRAAALQGLDKMKQLMDLGVPQAVLPPQERPDVGLLRLCGFTGADAWILQQASDKAPHLLSQACSSAAMWTANAASITPSLDALDKRLHITPANLVSNLHRCRESRTYLRLFQKLFSCESKFAVHAPLPACSQLADEGAANQVRLAPSHAKPGISLFIYGRSANSEIVEPRKFPARQTFESAQCLAFKHAIAPNKQLILQQHPDAIDAGVFHNDVISVGNENVFFYHEKTFAEGKNAIKQLIETYEDLNNESLHLIEVKESQLSLQDVVATYLFNSQLVTLPHGSMALICPIEARDNDAVRHVVDQLVPGKHPIEEVVYVDLRQSMQNGGGPACLRLRIALTEPELAALHPQVLLTDTLHKTLIGWVERWYREDLRLEDLGDPLLFTEARSALDELTKILDLGSLYDFQRTG